MPLANWGGGGWGGGGGVVEVENIEKEVITMMKIITLMPCSTKLIAQVIKKKMAAAHKPGQIQFMQVIMPPLLVLVLTVTALLKGCDVLLY